VAGGTADRTFFATQDLDFSDLRRFAPGTHHGILLLRLQNPTRRELDARIRAIFETEDIEAWIGCFVVATDHKIRIRRPQEQV
jgi:predicted nuclease of predicted toxin-antitoxin system